MDITDVKSALALVGHGLIVCEIFGSETIIDVYSNQRLTLGQFKTETTVSFFILTPSRADFQV
jgi:hypothetical protein